MMPVTGSYSPSNLLWWRDRRSELSQNPNQAIMWFVRTLSMVPQKKMDRTGGSGGTVVLLGR